MNKLYFLDKGYVRLVDTMGSDTTVVNAARVSFDKSVTELGDGDKRLIDFLAKHGHTSPFRHATLQFEMYVPMMIARQHWKYIVGSDHTMDAWNESSRRYVTENEEFYIPDATEWRSAPASTKQGSGEPVSAEMGDVYTRQLEDYVSQGLELYRNAMEDGIAPEQARLFLPANGMYVRYYWTGSLMSVAHVINQRTAGDAQSEFRDVASAIKHLAIEQFPYSLEALLK